MVAGKIRDYQDLKQLSTFIHNNNQRLVLTTGVFDLFHRGHRQFLSMAKKSGDVLWVGLETDARVKKIKGEDRPIDVLTIRLQKVASFAPVDMVFSLPESFSSPKEHEHLIAMVKPHVFAISAHSPHQKEKQLLVEKYGGSLQIVMQQDATISTTALLNKRKMFKK